MASKTISIPESWEEVKYKNYLRFIESIKDQEEDDKLVTEMMLMYLCNLNSDDYYNLKPSVFKQVTTSINNLIASQDSTKLITKFEAFGKEYRFEPELEKMSYGMYLDLTTYGKDVWKNMPILCSILYRPVKAKLGAMYELEPYNGTNDATISMFRELLTMDICHSVIGFFLSLQKDLVISSLTYSLKTVKESLTTQQLQALARNGVDIQVLSRYVEETLQSSMK